MNDVRYALRAFRAHPVTTLVSLLSLGIGLAVTAVVYSIADGMFLRPLPVEDPDGLVWIESVTTEGRRAGLAWRNYVELHESAGAFNGVAVQNRRGALVDRGGEASLVLLTVVSDDYFDLLGVKAAYGRLFDSRLDEGMMAEPAVAIGDALWKRTFGGDRALIGRAIRLNNRLFTVVGILPREFRGLTSQVRNDVWVPASTWKAMGSAAEFEARGIGQFEPVARLAPGRSIGEAQAELDSIAARWRESERAFEGRRLVATTQEMREPSKRLAGILLAAVALLVVIACVNVAMLLLAQGEARRREIAIRLATGASRGKLFRQLVTEGALLAAVCSIAALVAAYWLIPLVPAILPPGPDFMEFDIRVDARVAAVTLLAAASTVLLFALAPALAASRTDFNSVLRGAAAEQSKRFGWRRTLAAVQAALSVVLLAAAGLLARSFIHTASERPGFDTDRNVLVMLVSMNGEGQRNAVAAEELMDRVRALPGVKRAAYCRRTGLVDSGGGATVDVAIPGAPASPGQDVIRLRFNQISIDYFAVTGTRLLAGRTFERRDEQDAPVVLVNETMARRFWPGRSPVGEWVRVRNVDRQVLGVVEDAMVNSVHEQPEPFVYLPYAQMPSSDTTILVETTGAPDSIADAVKAEMRKVSSPPTLLTTETLRQQMRRALYFDRVAALLSGVVGMFALLLSALGLFGVVQHGVNRRMRELGIRAALGASPSDVMSLVLGQGLRLASAGAFAGVIVALAVGPLLAGFLFGVTPRDTLTLVTSVLIVIAVALAASFYPAWKATRIDPASTLRAE
ncbi:MAG: ADOP family duplicated permease [Vicinamibacterales bacterium]